MKITGIVLAVIGGLSALGSLTAGRPPAGLVFVVLGLFLISRAVKKKEKEEKKKQWEQENFDNK